MTHPTGAIRTAEEMQKLIGKHIFICAPTSFSEKKLLFVAPNIMKLHPISIGGIDYPYDPILLEVEEYVDAARMNGIAVKNDWSVAWGSPYPLYFFSNFWWAYVHVQQRDDLRAR